MAMTKSGLIAELAARARHIHKRDVELVVNTVFDAMTAALRRGERIELRGFGTFQVRQRESRLGRNPKSGASVRIPARRTAFFKVGKMLRELVEGGAARPQENGEGDQL